MILKCILVFLSMTLVDILWALYIKDVADSKANSAGVISAINLLCSGLVIKEYVTDTIYLFPAVLGAYVGTVITIKFKNRLKKND